MTRILLKPICFDQFQRIILQTEQKPILAVGMITEIISTLTVEYMIYYGQG